MFINFFTLVFQHNFYYADCTIWPNKRAVHPVAPKISVGRDLQISMVRLQLQLSASMADKPTVSYIVYSQPPAGPAWPRVKSQLMSFSKSPNSQPIASGHDVIHTPVFFYLGFLLWHLWLSYPLRTSVNCTQCVCTCTKSRIVQSPTKPNDKI